MRSASSRTATARSRPCELQPPGRVRLIQLDGAARQRAIAERRAVAVLKSVPHLHRHAIRLTRGLAREPTRRQRARHDELLRRGGSRPREKRHADRDAGLERLPAGQLVDMRLTHGFLARLVSADDYRLQLQGPTGERLWGRRRKPCAVDRSGDELHVRAVDAKRLRRDRRRSGHLALYAQQNGLVYRLPSRRPITSIPPRAG